MPKKGGSGSRKSVRVEEKAALEAEQAAAVVDAQTAAKEAQAAADAAAALQLSELECPTEGGSFDPPGSDQRGLPQLGFVKLLPQLPTRPRLGTDSPAPLPEFRSAVPRPLPLALAAQKYSLRLEGSMTFMWQAPVAPNKLTCVLGILLNSLQLSELECPTSWFRS